MGAIILTGFMGTGKSTVGRLLAQHLRKPFIDTDDCIEAAEGRSIAAIFADAGEAHFRATEARVVAEAVTRDAVVATGGGAITDPTTYARMHAAGPIICLQCDLEVLLGRLKHDTTRPLLAGTTTRARLTELLTRRAAAYAQADLIVDTTNRAPQDITEEIVRWLEDPSRRS